MDNTTDKIYVPMTKEEYLEWVKSKDADKDEEGKALEWNDDNVIKYICDKFYNQLEPGLKYRQNKDVFNKIYELKMVASDNKREIHISRCVIETNEGYETCPAIPAFNRL